jgi:hypothetical protein
MFRYLSVIFQFLKLCALSTPSVCPLLSLVEHAVSANINAALTPMLVISFFIIALLDNYFLMDGWYF